MRGFRLEEMKATSFGAMAKGTAPERQVKICRSTEDGEEYPFFIQRPLFIRRQLYVALAPLLE